jgi:glycosyltransferase involved in cell wall biosynthesis
MRRRGRRPTIRTTRVGVYVDTLFRIDGLGSGRIFTNSEAAPFMHFICEVASSVGPLVLFGRRADSTSRAHYPLPSSATLVELPHYPNLADAPRVIRAIPGTIIGMWRGVTRVDVILAFGPHPFSLILIAIAKLRGRRVVLGVRQDTMRYYRARIRSRRMTPVMPVMWLVDRAYHRLSRDLPTIVAGGYVERQYGGPRPGLEALRISLIRECEVASGPTTFSTERVRLLTVGRVDPEKNPFLLVDAVEELERRHPGQFQLEWLGEGRLEGDVRTAVRERGLEHTITMLGFVAFGPELMDHYRAASIFVHVAITEAFGQVLTEAMASGLPIIATDVGGVRWALDDGRAGTLVPPNDRDALVAAIEQMAADPELRLRHAEHGLELTRKHTLEVEARRVAALLDPRLAP